MSLEPKLAKVLDGIHACTALQGTLLWYMLGWVHSYFHSSNALVPQCTAVGMDRVRGIRGALVHACVSDSACAPVVSAEANASKKKALERNGGDRLRKMFMSRAMKAGAAPAKPAKDEADDDMQAFLAGYEGGASAASSTPQNAFVRPTR